MKEDSIFITDDNGKEVEMKLYLTFDFDGKQYAVLYEAGSSPDELVAFTYDDEGNMYAVEDDSELAVVEEVVNAYAEEN
ncbi:MAG: DUF1292 domain-containing protein [Erysipelotrichaceae bacterium]|nr:DUF1292 domain-containing protein [Erysipelotrichaceae bacterium]